MSDWTSEESSELMSYIDTNNLNTATAVAVIELDTSDLPESIDWRDLSAVTDVENQMFCGSCWAFSATATLEGAHAIATGELLTLSD
mmetsp:Transcript_3016/g.1973  ORF Transcript_3016/g.1973 Transcript_3016/m.1973 type:complete len:87 (-) Transcript_3016:569-829(-)